MEELSILTVIVVLIVLIGLFVIVRTLVMPRSFAENEEKRAQMRKRMLEMAEAQREKEPLDMNEGEDGLKSA